MENEIFLAVTSIDEAIDKDAERIIYIEDGCLKKKDNTEEFEIVGKPFVTADEVLQRINLINDEYEMILQELSVKLNKIHNKDLSIEAWRVILCMWLPYYMDVMFNKYSNVKKAITDYGNLYTNTLSEDSYIHPYYGYGFWIWTLKREDYNFQLYSHVLEYLAIKINDRICIKQNQRSSAMDRKKGIKDIGIKALNNIAKKAETIVVNPHNFEITVLDMIQLWLKSGFKMGFFFTDAVDIEPEMFNKEYRSSLELEINPMDSEFVRLIKKYIFDDMPTMYLEGFSKSIRIFEKYECKKIISAEDYPFYPAALLMGANKNRQGKLYVIPLGGDSNIWQGMSEAYLAGTIADILYTTGWKDNAWKCELRKITNPRYWKAVKNIKAKEKRCDILYVATATFAYRTLMSNVNSIFTKEYVEDSLMFLHHLSADNKIRIRARFFCETGWIVEKRKNKLARSVKTDDYKKRFIDTAQECRLCVVDSFGTAWAEALAMNIPLIIVIPQYMEFFSEKGWELVSKLKKAGIYYNNYTDANEYIQKNISNIELWWKNNERQKIIQQVKDEYVWCADNAKNEWLDEFIRISKE